MGIFGNDTPGKGVAKGERQKRPVFRFFELFGRKFWKLLQLNLIYFLFMLPIVTFGPATAAMTKMLRYFYTEKPVFLFSDFVKAFKENFRQSFVIGLVDIGYIAAFIAYLGYLLPTMDQSDTNWIFLAIVLVVTVFFLIVNFYCYLQIVTLSLTMKGIVKNALYLSILGLVNNIISMLVFVTVFIGILMTVPYSLAALPICAFSFVGFVVVFCSYPVLQKFVINPFYEAKGEKNPELFDEQHDEAVFVDNGGKDETYTGKVRGTGKIIK